MIFKRLLKARVIVWAAVTVFMVALLIVANSLATKSFSSLLDGVFGGKRAVVAEDESGIPFEQDFNTKQEAFDNANNVVKEICEEGMVLLKNKDEALPLTENKPHVSVFGKNSVKLVYGGSGSAAPGDGERKTIFDSLTAAGIEYNKDLKSFYESKASGSGRSANPAMEHGDIATLKTGETPYDSYTDAVKNSYSDYGDAAIVVFSRIAGENWDLPRVAEDNPNRHYLELDNNERELLRKLGESNQFKRIVILMNGSNYIDLGFLEERTNPTDYNDFGKYVDSAIVIGSPGANGIMALGEILAGKVTPSGHTVDTVYTRYNEDPTWQNFGGNFTKGGDAYLKAADGNKTGYFLVEYEENIYSGYRYYETADFEAKNGRYDGFDYDKSVVYPFGHGLSYTTFEESIVNVTSLQTSPLKATEKFEVSIKVKNTGNKYSGKDVVQLYVTAPYSANGIEKAHKVLVGFAKTKLLEPGKEDTVKITVDPYDFASFDSRDKNSNSFKGWELEKGEYIFHVAKDAHHDIATFVKTLAEDYKFEKDPITGYEVKPLFDEVTAHMDKGQNMSRNDMKGTFPVTITDDERKVDNAFLKTLRVKNTNNTEEYTEMPITNAEITVDFKSLAGKEYDDPLWEEFLNQMTFDEMLKLFNEGCYSTVDIGRLGIPKTTSADGPTGMVAFLGDPSVYGCCYYCSECLLAQTYNIDLAAKQGNAIGNECLIGNEKGDGMGYPGWYAPGVNIHRSPFSGRNTEYYSEDPFLNGKFAAQVIKSVQEKGVYANVKHYALNDQETNRSANGIATWCDEQAMREIYLKPFEFAVKEGKTHGLMTSFNRIGVEWAGGSYRLVTTILRNEWGFRGSVICDFHTDSYMDSRQMLYAGGDLNLCSTEDCKLRTDDRYGAPISASDIKDVSLLRKSAHNNLYAIANSCALKVDVLYYKPALWRIALWSVDGAIAGVLVIWGFFAIFTALRKKEEVKVEEQRYLLIN